MFSPDGKQLAYVAMKRPGFEADRFALMLLDLNTGAIRELAADWDRSVSGLAWTADSAALIALARSTGLSAYDATYLLLAIGEGLPLATLDQRLADAAIREGVPVVG